MTLCENLYLWTLSMAKKCKECGKLNENPLLKYCMEHGHLNKTAKQTTPLKRTPLARSTKPVVQISEKRKKRISSGWGEAAMFKEIWDERPHVCEMCPNKIPKPRTYCFAHRCPKGTYPEHRLKKENISLVCSIKCHWEVDKLYSWIKRADLSRKLNEL